MVDNVEQLQIKTNKVNPYLDRVLSEKQLAMGYADNGYVVGSEEAANTNLAKKGYIRITTNMFKNKYGKKAFVYRLRDTVFEKCGSFKKYSFEGYLISFGGEPRSCYELKFTKIERPKF